MSLLESIRENREAILRIAARHGASDVRIFGSIARGQETDASDVDFLVKLEKGRTLFDQAALLADLEDLLGRKVDVVTEDGIYHLLRRRVLKEARPI